MIRPTFPARWLPIAALATIVVLPGCAAASPPVGREPGFGAHVGAGCNGRADIPRYEKFVGRKLEWSTDAFDQRDWAKLRSSIDWLSGCWRGTDVKLIISIPMIAQSGPGTLKDGAEGKFDDIFLHSAKTLVKDGHDKVVIRIGWEFNGGWQPWAANKDPANFIAYYRRAVGLMRSVPGQHFKFEWTPNIGRNALPAEQGYPGDDVVDIIGMDIYNEYWTPALANTQVRFAWFVNQPYGLNWLRDFGKQHHKPIAFSEWGSGTRKDGHGAGDDPYFITKMAEWMRANDVLYHSYWESAESSYDDSVTRGAHPLAGKAFREAFGKRRKS
ncbi:glycoside hydrolase family 26 protein [Sphingomonas immobilis]|uniref:Glycosyl hydrolase n=1 Tax=Sphingomonas immobilis TaxID=3063997 RepID=A0ABT9A769_9SPHN|nr:glycosyl hydrolase [Sphingomonas sp. CA1-15]MDO7844612.1 glycosyl hydrolase [Sphingomonas sp. CA1-15]